jgi:hypothetical protein
MTLEDSWKFWAPIVAPNGVLDAEQVKKELYDYSVLLDQVPKVYCHITRSLVSKPNTDADAVIQVADEQWQDEFQEAIKEETEELTAQLAASQAEVARLRETLDEVDGIAWLASEVVRTSALTKHGPDKATCENPLCRIATRARRAIEAASQGAPVAATSLAQPALDALPIDEDAERRVSALVKQRRKGAPAPTPALALVLRQAEDPALWFHATNASEAYLQRALRELHAAVEGAPGKEPSGGT